MFEFLSVFGPAALTFLIVRKLTGKSADNYFSAMLEYILYAGLDVLVVIVLLLPFSRVRLVIMPNGLKGLRYGGMAYVLSYLIAVIVAIVAAAVKKRLDISLEISQRKEKTHEDIKD